MGRALGILLVAIVAAGAQAQAPTYGVCVNNEQLRHYATVSDPQLAPDGARVVWVQREATTDGAATHLWMAGSDGGAAPRQVTFAPADDKAGESSPQWMPDGSAVLFVAKRGETRQIFRLPLGGGEAAPLTIAIPGKPEALGLSVGGFAIAPDGRWIAVRAAQPQTAAQSKDRKDKKDAVIVDDPSHPQRVWLFSLASGKTVALTAADRQAVAMAWSPDSRQLAVITAAPGNADDLGPQHRLQLIAINNPGQARTLAQAPASVNGVVFSPSGSELALTAQSGHDTPPGVGAVLVMPAAGDAPRDLSDSDDLTVSGREVVWAADGTALYVGTARQTTGGLVRLPASGGAATWLPTASAVDSGFATNLRRSGWVYVTQASDRLPQIAYRANLESAQETILSRANPDWTATGWSAATVVNWPGADGMTIQGLYFAPRSGCAGAAAAVAGKSPMILVVHGGPTGAFAQTFSPFVQWLTSQGWAVLEPNPRGSTGYGWQFAAANKNDLGGKDYQDVMAGVDWALANRPIDAHRLGMYGYSYGGEMAGFIEGKSDRFAAIVSGAPVIDQYSEYGTEDGSWYDRWFFGRPWLRPQDAWRQSPLSYAGKAHTPLLLLQGQTDITDPLGQSEEMYRALRQMGVPVRLVTFPREVHGTLGGAIGGAPSAEPWHGLEARAEIEKWFSDHFAD